MRILPDESEKRENTIKKWIAQFPEIIDALRKRKVDVKIFEGLITKDWAEEVYNYLYDGFKKEILRDCKKQGRQNLGDDAIHLKFRTHQDGTLDRINKGDFFSLIYFFHEVCEIKCLQKKGLKEDNKDRDCHKDALIKEFSTLETIASQMGYKVLKGALFHKYPPYERVNGKSTKDIIDEPLLANESSFKFQGCEDEEVAVCFYNDVGKITENNPARAGL